MKLWVEDSLRVETKKQQVSNRLRNAINLALFTPPASTAQNVFAVNPGDHMSEGQSQESMCLISRDTAGQDSQLTKFRNQEKPLGFPNHPKLDKQKPDPER